MTISTRLETSDEFTCHNLDESHRIYSGKLPDELRWNIERFDQAWSLHPTKYTLIHMHGRLVSTPRWQQAYGRSYRYTGQVNQALPVPSLLEPLLNWCQTIDSSLNGLLLNWYDGALNHYIGKHRDSISNLRVGSPIVTISFGEQRIFRLRPHKGTGKVDLVARDGTVFVMPFATNRSWTHEIPKSKSATGRRISVTARAFLDGEL